MHAADVVVVLMLSAPPQTVEVAQVEPAAQITLRCVSISPPPPSSPGSGRAFFTARIRMSVPHLPIEKARRRERSAECR